MQRILIPILLCLSSVAMAMDRFTIEYYFRDTDVRVIDDEKGTSIVLPNDRLFAEPTDVIFDIEEYPAMEEVLHVVRKHSDMPLSITVHTDSVPPQPYQYELSYQQAKQVADYLTSGGVNPNRIQRVSGEGDRYPIASNENALGRAANRRVEITFLREHREHEGTRMPSGVVGIPESFVEPEAEMEREERKSAAIYKGSK
jgi:flagellar motor protein MotB